MNGRDRFIAALKGEARDHAPVYPLLMYFAAVRSGLTYREFASDGKALADAQMKVQAEFGLDCISNCSDISRITSALGGEIFFPETTTPHLVDPIVTCEADIDKIGRPDPTDRSNRMGDRSLSVEEMKKGVGDACAVSGWIDMPFAEACAACGLSEFMMMMFDNPKAAHKLLDKLTLICCDFAVAQARAGADIIGCGDAAASLISDEQFLEFALPYERRVVEAVHNAGVYVKTHICGNTSHLLDDIASNGGDLFNVDHLVDLEKAKEVYDSRGVAFKGNVDPVAGVLQATPEECEKKCHQCMDIAGDSWYILSAGCEIPAEVSDEVFRAFCNSVKTYKK